jgi:hypothetical protein
MSRTTLTIGLLGMLLLVACAPTKHATLPAPGADVAVQAEPAGPATLPQAGEPAAAPEAKAQPPAAPVSAPPPAPPPAPAPVGTARRASTSAPAPSSAPASRPAAVSSTKPALPAKPAAPAPSGQAAPQPVAPAGIASSARPAAAPALDVHSLETQLRETKAIGVFTKIALKNQVDDLLDRFRAYYSGESKTTLTELRQGYNLLLMKVLSLLQDGDPPLAKRIVESREAIWGILADPKKFSQNNLMAGG